MLLLCTTFPIYIIFYSKTDQISTSKFSASYYVTGSLFLKSYSTAYLPFY